ncbi:MAG: hypothetical protein MZV64_04495 [Ignavibacteriales bacterium]|nr:hypothetical protein [Ignavibacteriales bacterium]
MFVIIGFVVVLVSVLGGFWEAGGPFLVLIQPAEFLIIGGAAPGRAARIGAEERPAADALRRSIGALKGETVTQGHLPLGPEAHVRAALHGPEGRA